MSGTKIAMPQPNSFQSGALSFMSCTSGRESSPLDENDSHQTSEFKTETKKKRFHPLRNLRRMFRRKTRRSSISTESYQSAAVDSPEITPANLEQRSCSTSRLQEENLTQNLFRNSRLNPGLSLSHDSVFTPERTDSGLSSSDLENSSLSITVLTPPSKECPMKSQSSCSESSLLSIESSEVELSPVRGGKTSELDVGTTAYTLSHSAARHKMAVKPRRNHGVPRSRRRALASKSPLPITLEVSEEGATGRNSPPSTPSALDSPGLLPKCDRPTQGGKISWSDFASESNTKDPEDRGSARTEDETDLAKEDEMTTQRTESFFGRFLSRRSDKKKKLLRECNPEESSDERGSFAKEWPKSAEGKGMVARKTPSRRQRVEPVEIPSTSCLKKYDVDKDKSGVLGKSFFLGGSISPPTSNYPNQVVTSRSMSPPKVVWPESCSPHQLKPETALLSTVSSNLSSANQSADSANDRKNPNFVKELTVSVSSFAREKSGKREKDDDDDDDDDGDDGDEDEETVLKIRRQHSEDATPQKPFASLEDISPRNNESPSSDSVESENNCPEESGQTVAVPGCVSVKTLTLFPAPFDSVHDGYDNVKIIEQVKQEATMTSPEARAVAATPTPEPQKATRPEVSPAKGNGTEQSREKEAEAVARVKPAVSEKPKDLKRAGVAESAKASSSWKEPRKEPSEQLDARNDKGFSKAKATLVERRKSELLLLTDTEEREVKTRPKPPKKQPSFSEVSLERRPADSTGKTPPLQARESSGEKTEATPPDTAEDVAVVFRKKSVANASSDEQPELMKVFARRSLKVREGEKIVEDVHRSRDSDKENEIVDSPKEDRRKEKTFERDEKKDADKTERVLAKEKPTEIRSASVTAPKSEGFRKSPLSYARSLSENNGKTTNEEADPKKESPPAEGNRLSRVRSPMEEIYSVRLDRGEKDEGEAGGEAETGFKRIQQRKAEWERRAQQGAK